MGASSEDLRPTGLVLGYPVISLSEFVHKGSFQNLCGDDAQLMEWLSLEKCVTEDMPPTFVFHTLEDSSVPVENSLLLAEAMRKASVSFTLHVFPYGGHGLSLATPEVGRRGKEGQVQPLMQCWLDLVADWCGRCRGLLAGIVSAGHCFGGTAALLESAHFACDHSVRTPTLRATPLYRCSPYESVRSSLMEAKRGVGLCRRPALWLAY